MFVLFSPGLGHSFLVEFCRTYFIHGLSAKMGILPRFCLSAQRLRCLRNFVWQTCGSMFKGEAGFLRVGRDGSGRMGYNG